MTNPDVWFKVPCDEYWRLYTIMADMLIEPHSVEDLQAAIDEFEQHKKVCTECKVVDRL